MRRTLSSLRAPASSLRSTPTVSPRALLSSTRPSSLPRKAHEASAQRTSRRSSTSSGSSAPHPPPPSRDEERSKHSGPAETSSEASNVKDEKSKSPSAPPLPFSSDIFWSADNLINNPSPDSSLPPREIFDEVLNNLIVSFRPQIQQRAAYSSSVHGPAAEPNLHLYCPIEGGDYIIDETVRELARRTGSDVVVLDAAHMAAGEHGHYGPAGALVNFNGTNPLHFASRPPPSSRNNREDEDDGEGDESSMPMSMNGMGMMGMPHMMLQVIPSGKPRPQMSSTTTSSGAPLVFFDLLVNMTVPEVLTPGASKPPPCTQPSRIIYVRDFPTIAGSASSWYPALQSAVRMRRQGAENAVVVIFGSTPSVTTLAHSASGAPSTPSPRGVHSDLVLRREPPVPSSSGEGGGLNKEKRQEAEDEAAEKARERRLRERLRRWERGPAALANDIPRLSTDDSPASSARGGNGLITLRDLTSVLPSFGPRTGQGSPGISGDSETGFFRTSVLVPETRAPLREKDVRMERRREINGLTLRMAVGAIGGVLPTSYVAPEKEVQEGKGEEGEEADEMWTSWGRHLRSWAAIQRNADQAMGTAMRTQGSTGPGVIPVGWDDVRNAWAEQRTLNEVRRGWVRSVGKEEDSENGKGANGAKEEQEEDPLVEEVRADPDLDTHTQRLLGCIVDRASMRTTFSQVHLPPATIDAVRTMASLPLLHPDAFSHGILREHGMTGCLLFGPPGTGKTLVVRALAKEAGTRMLSIAPSDVMDMYVGEGEKLVKAVFTLARRLAPCIVFLDELDALFGARSGSRESGGAMAHRGVLTEFMQEMDGLRSASSGSGVVVIGATNRPFDLDDAVLRRLPRRLLVDLPGEEERAAILRILLQGETLATDVDVAQLAKDTLSFSGSDLKHLAVAAALDAVKESVDLPWRQSTPAVESTDPVSASKIDKATPSVHGNVVTSAANEVTETDTPHDLGSSVAPFDETNDSQSASIDTSAASPPIDASPNNPTSSVASSANDSGSPSKDSLPTAPQRVLYARHFARALKEITPSASEHLGTLADLRKWNDEFGDGASSRRRRKTAVWGKDRFGFTNRWGKEADGKVADGRAER